MVVLVGLVGCGVEMGEEVTDGEVSLDEQDSTAVAEQDVSADVLNVKFLESDVAVGTLTGRTVKVFTDARSAKAFLGGSMPSVDFAKNWLIAYRPAGKTPGSRVQVTRAQLSANGKTLSLWATVTEPAAGCTPWKPNEVSVIRVPKRSVVPTTTRVTTSAVTASCGLVFGAACTPGAAACPAATPLCHGGFERSDGVITGAVCARLPRYEGTSNTCRTDADCGPGGICTGNLVSQGEGLCQASWMRGTFSMPESGQLSAPIAQGGGWTRLLVRVTGQATVPMDASYQVFIDGLAPSRIERRLVNPSGTVSTPLMGLPFGTPTNAFVPGDEAINGEWAVEVRDVGTGAPGSLRGVRLSLTSRWD